MNRGLFDEGTAGKKKVLLVDDDEMHLVTAGLFLHKKYEIYKAGSGKEALECLCGKKFVPDIILLDMIMPETDGWQVFKKIKKTGFLENVPVVFLTSVKERREIGRASRMGAADYIFKPLNMVELRNSVEKVLNGYRMKVIREDEQ